MEERRYFGCRVIQRVDSNTVPFFVFYARSKDIKEWTGIRRVEDSSDGTQRVLRPTRMRAITRFLKSFSKNTIPNNILLAFDENSDNLQFHPLNSTLQDCLQNYDLFNGCEEQIQWGAIQFSFDPKAPDHLMPALLVDGQHRLYGISNFESEDLPILVVSLLNAPVQEQAFQFVVINNKAVRVPTDNVRAIIAHLDEDELQDRLLKAGVNYGNKSPLLRDINDLDSSPFQHLLKWPYNKEGKQLVPLTAIEQAVGYTRSALKLSDDDDSVLEIFCAIWRAIKANYPTLWGKDEEHYDKFMKKVNINAMNEFLCDRLKFAWELSLLDIFDSTDIENQILNIVRLLPKEFWEEKWSIRIQDNANVRNLIKGDLETLINNSRMKRRWREGLKILAYNDSDDEE